MLGAMAPPVPPRTRAFTAGLLALVRSAKDAVAQWLYEPPADAPIAFDVVIAFTPEGDGEVIVASAPDRLVSLADAASARSRGDSAATKVKHVTPVYPPAAREAKITGIVILEARIGAEGRVSGRACPAFDS